MSHEVLNFLKYDGFILLYGITFLFSILRYRKYFDSVLKYLPIIIGYTFLTELLGYIMRVNDSFQILFLDSHSVSNSVFYNIFDLIFFLYFFYIYWQIASNLKHKIYIKYGGIIYILASIVNPIFQDFILLPQILSLTIGSIVLVSCTILYFLELNSKTKRIPYRKNLLFWISIGLLCFYTFYPVVMVVALYYKNYVSSIRPLHFGLIIFMYSCFILGFLQTGPMRRISEEM